MRVFFQARHTAGVTPCCASAQRSVGARGPYLPRSRSDRARWRRTNRSSADTTAGWDLSRVEAAELSASTPPAQRAETHACSACERGAKCRWAPQGVEETLYRREIARPGVKKKGNGPWIMREL